MRVRYSFSSRHTRMPKGECQHRREFPDIAREVIGKSDIVVEVLDARYIEETRNKEFEEMVKSIGKVLIYALNKSDLINEKQVRQKMVDSDLHPYVLMSCKLRRGSAALRDRIKIEVKKLGIKDRKAQVGVIGYPNTGKSSVINILTGRPAAGIGKSAGFTRGLQKIKLTGDIVMFDTPGVIPIGENSELNKTDLVKHAIINVRTYDKIKDPEFVVHKLVNSYPEAFDRFYCINARGDSEKLIEELGRKKAFLRKKGAVDTDRTARAILKDWQEGIINL